MSEQLLENIVAQKEILELLIKQKKDGSPETFDTDLKNPEQMSRSTYAALSLLLIDDSTRISAGLEPARLSRDQKTEIKRVCRSSEFIFLHGLGVIKKRPIDPETGKPIPPPPREPRQERQYGDRGNGYGQKSHGGKPNNKSRDLSADAAKTISNGPYKGPKKDGQQHRHDRHDERREREPIYASTEPPKAAEPAPETTLTDKVVAALNANDNISAAQGRTNEQGCRQPEAMVKSTAQALLNLRRKQSNGHDMQAAFLVKGIDELLDASPWKEKLSTDRSAIVESN